MMDYRQIGRRIAEERRQIWQISTAQLAEETGLSEEEITHLEAGERNGRDVGRGTLEALADFFGVPVQTLLEGRVAKDALPVYSGDPDTLKASTAAVPPAHQAVLDRMAEQISRKVTPDITTVFGPLTFYQLLEEEVSVPGYASGGSLQTIHTIVFWGDEVAARMTTAMTNVFEHVYLPAMRFLASIIPWQTLDVTDVWRTLNPYAALWQYSEDGPERDDYEERAAYRIDDLYALGDDRPVLYVESLYVREDCRRNQICRMCLDLLETLLGGSVIWVNLEPHPGELSGRYPEPVVTPTEVEQIHLNAKIAGKLALTVDPDIWHRKELVIDEAGNEELCPVEYNKCAYILPPEILEIVKDDAGLVALGRERQKTYLQRLQREEEENRRARKKGLFGGLRERLGGRKRDR